MLYNTETWVNRTYFEKNQGNTEDIPELLNGMTELITTLWSIDHNSFCDSHC